MVKIYDKSEVREGLTLENIFDLLESFGGNPEYTDFGIVSNTICHNPAGEGSRKLYYYENSGLFQCYSNCGSFDPFELVIKIFKIQKGIEFDLNDAVRYVAQRFGIFSSFTTEDNVYEDDIWKILNKYDRVNEVDDGGEITLKTYDPIILSRLNYNVNLRPWLNDGITQEVLHNNLIGYYPSADQITIPHFDKDGNFIGLRGRSMCKEDCDRFGKYRPVSISKIIYKHPLGMNLYNFNNSKRNIKIAKKAIVFEGKSKSFALVRFSTASGVIN